MANSMVMLNGVTVYRRVKVVFNLIKRHGGTITIDYYLAKVIDFRGLFKAKFYTVRNCLVKGFSSDPIS